jgi:nicotinamide N-methyltransferase
MCGAEKVVITDYPDQSLVDNMVWNADVNLVEDVRRKVDVEGFVWGAKVDSLLAKSDGEGYDVLILSDLVFNHSQVSLVLCNHSKDEADVTAWRSGSFV